MRSPIFSEKPTCEFKKWILFHWNGSCSTGMVSRLFGMVLNPFGPTPHTSSIESTKAQLVEMSSEKERAETQLKDAEHEMKKQKQQMQEMQERGALNGEVSGRVWSDVMTSLIMSRFQKVLMGQESQG